MSIRELDVIIFGATGFTGKHTIAVLHKLIAKYKPSLKYGVAGRKEKGLKEALAFAENELDGADLSDVPIVIADVTDEESLNQMARKTRMVVNCCGPYRFYGEPVVKACIAQSTHHVDVSGEPQYMEAMQVKYHEAALEKGVYILSACGVDSIPIDLGIVFLEEKFGGTLNSVETYLKMWEEKPMQNYAGPAINYGTWYSLVYGLAHANELRGLRRQLFKKQMPQLKPKLETKALPHKTPYSKSWSIIFPTSDRSVVRRSQYYFYNEEKKRPVQIQTYMFVQSLFMVLMMGVIGVVLNILVRFKTGRSLLLKYPRIFSGGFFSDPDDKPSEEAVKNAWFSFTLHGVGWDEKLAEPNDEFTTPVNKMMAVKVQGNNPGYGATCVLLVVSALMVLLESDKMPKQGGIYPPAAAFAKTSMIEKLHENGVTFEVVKEQDIHRARF